MALCNKKTFYNPFTKTRTVAAWYVEDKLEALKIAWVPIFNYLLLFNLLCRLTPVLLEFRARELR